MYEKDVGITSEVAIIWMKLHEIIPTYDIQIALLSVTT